jgi:hypothetical protein
MLAGVRAAAGGVRTLPAALVPGGGSPAARRIHRRLHRHPRLPPTPPPRQRYTQVSPGPLTLSLSSSCIPRRLHRHPQITSSIAPGQRYTQVSPGPLTLSTMPGKYPELGALF